ncbi:hypothetical protein BDV24DRAFT_132914 [Aspergillus arachidicola]|uniref:Uncharacterized protein n=1 Tax=Aspergillus arachidicola TaxID=656916 RepID=A0A5N6Y9F1_9EURO|nr:hypothetical protein BDV24DRAFT_132914 [Aspergillus arachidicola]
MENPIEVHFSKIQLSSDERDYLRGDNARVTGGMMTKIERSFKKFFCLYVVVCMYVWVHTHRT